MSPDEPVDARRPCVPSGCVTGLEWSVCVGQNYNVFAFIPSATKDVPVSTVLLALNIPTLQCSVYLTVEAVRVGLKTL